MKQFRLFFLIFIFASFYANSQPIDRQAVVQQHQVNLRKADTLAALSVGNGRFACTVDVTGLQTFPEAYQNGIPLGTQSDWGWHSFPDTGNFRLEETIENFNSHGREVPYARHRQQNKRQSNAADYLRQNPHRIHLANIGWQILKKNGQTAQLRDIHHIRQTLDPWTGEVTSLFRVEGQTVAVTTLADQQSDRLAVKVESKLLAEGRLRLSLRYPTPTDTFLDNAAFYGTLPGQVFGLEMTSEKILSLGRRMDDLEYFTTVASSLPVTAEQQSPHQFVLHPDKQTTWSFTVHFGQTADTSAPGFEAVQKQAAADWNRFWLSGGMIDFGAVKDKRARELERRMILSLYLTKINCAGRMPPQETGLTQNSWYGKPHLEMEWWHGVHFALWGRPDILAGHLEWYLKNADKAREIAQRQGFKGVRWQKMTDPAGQEAPSSVGAHLIWQQPHFIYFAELLYRADPAVLGQYASLVEATAEFMADFAYFDPELGRYILGKGIIPAQERFDPAETFNPTYELAYWRWALETAQQWRERLGLSRQPKWDEVLQKLSPLPVQDGVYLAAESAPDSYTNPRYITDHPSVLGTLGMLPPTNGLDMQVMEATFDKIWRDWKWNNTWGWDFPMTAMTAARLGKREQAVNALLMPVVKNTYLPNGHNYQTKRLRLYLPGNGGLLIALAMMAEGYDGSGALPGFPKNWPVRYEGLVKMP